MEYQGKLNESTHLFYIVFQVLKVPLINFCIVQSPGLLVLIVLHQFLHQQMSFFTTFQNFIQHYLKQDFCMNFPFINGFTQPPHVPTDRVQIVDEKNGVICLVIIFTQKDLSIALKCFAQAVTNFLLLSAENTKKSHVSHFNNHNSGS